MNWTNVTVKLKDLAPWDENPKGITKKRAKALLDYWDEIGQFQTIAIGPKNGNGLHPLYDGHQRLDVLKAAYGPDLDIDARESSRALSDDERAKMTLMSIVGTTGFIDWDIVTAWDNPATQEWGLDAETLGQWNVDAGALGLRLELQNEAGFDGLPTEDRAEFQQMTFTLHDSQVETVKDAIRKTDSMDTENELNENGNGNAIAFICEMFLNGNS